jgi:hypothetical protein
MCEQESARKRAGTEGRVGGRGRALASGAHFEEVVEIALVSDFAEVNAEKESEDRLYETGEKSHNVPLLHRLREYDETAAFHYCFAVLQGKALEARESA